jgi:protein CMS1
MTKHPGVLEEDFQDHLPSDRKRNRDEEGVGPNSSKRKKKARRKITAEEIFDEELGVNTAIGQMDSQLLVDHVAKRTKKFEPNVSAVEMENRYIPIRAVLDTTSWDMPRTTENLPAFLDHFGGKNLSTAPEVKGSPHTLVVAGAGLRAADLTRTLREFQTKDAIIAKLFAKHIKLKEAVESCKKYR